MRSRYICSNCNKLFFGLGTIIHHYETCIKPPETLKKNKENNST